MRKARGLLRLAIDLAPSHGRHDRGLEQAQHLQQVRPAAHVGLLDVQQLERRHQEAHLADRHLRACILKY